MAQTFWEPSWNVAVQRVFYRIRGMAVTNDSGLRAVFLGWAELRTTGLNPRHQYSADGRQLLVALHPCASVIVRPTRPHLDWAPRGHTGTRSQVVECNR